MGKDFLAKACTKGQEFLVTNRNPILVGIGLSGILASDVLLVKGTIKAVRKIDAENAKREQAMTKKEIFQLIWKDYAPPAGMTLASFTSIIFAMKNEHGKAVTSTLACTMSEAALREYKEKVVQTIGEKKEKEVYDAISKDKVQEMEAKNPQIIVPTAGKVAFIESITNQPFESDWETVRKVVNDLNERLQEEMRITVNEYYAELGIDPVKIGDALGWENGCGRIDIYPSAQLTKDNRPCVVINHNVDPRIIF